MDVRWKYIKNTNNEYIITDNGDIYSYKKCKYTMLLKHKHNKGFSLIRVK